MHLHWEYFLLVSFLRFGLIITEHEDVSTDGVGVHVAEEEYVSRLQGSLHH